MAMAIVTYGDPYVGGAGSGGRSPRHGGGPRGPGTDRFRTGGGRVKQRLFAVPARAAGGAPGAAGRTARRKGGLEQKEAAT